jgi:citrate synthase
MNETTTGILLGGLMGFFGGLITIPINALFNYWLKRDELEYSQKLESIAKQRELLLQHKLEMEKRGKKLRANVDFYSASVYYMLGITTDLYTPIFAVSRISGWTAHVLEQLSNNKLIRPRAEYTGELNLSYIPMEQRK